MIRKINLSAFILICFISLGYSQTQIDIIGVNYSLSNQSNYLNKTYAANASNMDVFINYGNDLGKKVKVFYHLSYYKKMFNTQFIDYSIDDETTIYNKIPNFYYMNFAVGMTNKFNNNWRLTNIINYSFSNNNDVLVSHSYYKSFTYLKKKKTVNFSYGFGIYLSKLNQNLEIYPIINILVKNKKRGIKLFLPREVKLWQQLNPKSFIQIQTILNANYIRFVNTSNGIELLNINTDLTYNYLLNKKIHLKLGVGMPYTQIKYDSSLAIEKTHLTNFSIVAGLSYVVFKTD